MAWMHQKMLEEVVNVSENVAVRQVEKGGKDEKRAHWPVMCIGRFIGV